MEQNLVLIKFSRLEKNVNLFAGLWFKSQFNKRESLVNPSPKSVEAHFDTTCFSAKIKADFTIMNQKETKMNEAELVEEVANQTGLTRKTSREAVDAVTSVIADSLARREKATLVGFGTFQVMERKARRGVNPQTGESIRIPGKNVPKFRPGKSLRERVK